MAKQRETTHVAEPFILTMESRGWTCENIVGSLMQNGLPDYFCYHPSYGSKWVEFKVFRDDKSNYVKTTPAQKIKFPAMLACGVPIYAIADHDLRGEQGYKKRLALYKKLFEEPNAHLLFDNSMFHLLRVHV